MLKSWTIVIAIHAVIATAALVLGAFNLLRKTKGDPLHKGIGRTWAGLMLVTSVSGMFIGGYTDFLGIFLHALAIWTIISIVSGIYFARRGNIVAHRGFMSGSYYGLLGALIGVVSVPTRRVPSWFHAYPLFMGSCAALIIIASWLYIYFVYSHLRSKA